MGYERHRAILVTGYYRGTPLPGLPDTLKDWTSALTRAHTKATELFTSLVSPIIESGVNSVASFMVAPDGSKVGWDISDEAEAKRREFVAWMRAELAGNVDWVEVQYGDDERVTKVVDHSDA